jgi:hypothetical protein
VPEPVPEAPVKPEPETPRRPDKAAAAPTADDESGGRSQLNQIRAALADEPKEPKPRPVAKKPKAK